MNNKEFEQFVLDNGKEILRFCRMTCADREAGDELYQDTMLKLLSKMRSLDLGQNVRSYALSVSILLWKNKKKKYANRNRLIPMESMDRLKAEGNLEIAGLSEASPENCIPSHPEELQKQFREQFRCQDHRFPDRKHNHIHCKHIFSSQDSFQSVRKKMHLLFYL